LHARRGRSSQRRQSDGFGEATGDGERLDTPVDLERVDAVAVRRQPAGFKITRIGVPAEAKEKIRESLDKVGINESTMFPEIESAARYIMSKVTPVSGEEEEDP
jgi:hypothetical protein